MSISVLPECSEVLVSETVERFAKAVKNINEAAYRLVNDMSAMSESERRATVNRLKSLDGICFDWVDRIEACAARGIVEARHLFKSTRVLTANQIHFAAADALRQIADPEEEFIYVDDKGIQTLLPAKELNCRHVSKVWDLKTGKESPKKQRDRMKKAITGDAATKAGIFGSIESAIPFADQHGREMLEIRIQNEEDKMETLVVCLRVRQLRRFLK